MKKEYIIFLDGKKIGKTFLERADAPMGVVQGKIIGFETNLDYDFFKSFCQSKNIEFNDYPEDKLILTRTIDFLKVINPEGIEIKGVGNQIFGMDSDVFEIAIEGVPHPFYEEEFPHHVKAHNDYWNEKSKEH